MIQFGHPAGFDPFTTQVFGSGDARLFADNYFSAFPVNWKAQSNAHALLINEEGRLVYGGAAIEYALNAYTKTYGGASIEYTLGGIVLASMDSSAAASAPFVANTEYGVTIASSGSSTTAFAPLRLVDVVAASAAAGVSAALANMTTEALVESSATAGAVFIVDGAEYDVWVFNAETFAASRYINYAFNSFASFQGRYYGASSEGLYELSGATDDGVEIPASIMFGRQNFGSSRQKRVLRAYLGGTSGGKMILRVVGDDGAVRTYSTNVALGDTPSYRRADPARGLTAHYWQFEIRNEGGADFALDGLDLYPVILQRRVK